MNTQATNLDQLLVHAAWLRRFAGALVRDGDEADDLVQSTLVSAWQHPPADDSRPRSWLARIAQNRAHDLRRGEKRREAREATAHEAIAAQPPTPEQLMGDLQIHRAVAEVVTALHEPYRQTVLLRYYEGLTAADIASRMGVPAGTVRWRLKEGLDRVRRGLDGRCGDRKRWMLALAPLLPRLPGAEAAPAGAAGTARSSAAAGLALLAGVTVLLVVALGWWALGDRSDPTAADPTATGAAGSPTGPPGSARRGPPPRLAARAAAPALLGAGAGTDPALVEADSIVRHMLKAIASGSYDEFMLYADDTFKAHLDKETIDKAMTDLSAPLDRGFQIVPLGSVYRQGHQTFLWRLELPGDADQFLVNLSLKDGQVGGFWIQ